MTHVALTCVKRRKESWPNRDSNSQPLDSEDLKTWWDIFHYFNSAWTLFNPFLQVTNLHANLKSSGQNCGKYLSMKVSWLNRLENIVTKGEIAHYVFNSHHKMPCDKGLILNLHIFQSLFLKCFNSFPRHQICNKWFENILT